MKKSRKKLAIHKMAVSTLNARKEFKILGGCGPTEFWRFTCHKCTGINCQADA